MPRPPHARTERRAHRPWGSMVRMALKLGILTPFLWSTQSAVNDQVRALAERLTAAGHRVTVIAPSADRPAVEEAQRNVQAVLTGERETVFLPDEPYPRYFFAGATYAVKESGSLKLIAAPADLIANIDVLLGAEDFDLLHLNEPFVPGLGWSALRYAGCPLVATFHANPEKMRPFWSTRPQLRRLFDSLDAAIASSAAVRDAAAVSFPGAYRVIPPGVDHEVFHPAAERPAGPLRIVFSAGPERRKGLGVLLRASAAGRRARRRRRRRVRRGCPGAPLRTPRAAWLAGPRPFPRAAAAHGGRRPAARRRRLLRAVGRPRDGGRRPARGHGLRRHRGGLADPRLRRGRAERGHGPPGAAARRQGARGGALAPADRHGVAAPARDLRAARLSPLRLGARDRPRSSRCTTKSRAGDGTRFRAAAASSASCSPTSTSTRTTARTA